ncbi:YadA C-terminal domain-containing protein [Photobacterium sanguinicancri]|uniref:YadA C-terminal domain-containing protein n=1 Tax=Photobacterium sanguinicancri TaxID=875932 RepID=UPI0026E12AAA|nr:YadA-like family protein [Photobacterium sanguinicancri]MDO6497705.1 YadA-like family protein [Photobacterium sanguinicancri]
MKKSVIAISLATLFSTTAMAASISQPITTTPSHPIEVERPVNPIEQIPSNPIEIERPVNPIESTPSNPIEVQPEHPDLPMKPTNPIEQTPTNPIQPGPSNPIEIPPEHPIEVEKPTQPIEGQPENPIELPPVHPIEPEIDPEFGVQPKSNESVRIDNLEKTFNDFAEETNRRFSEVDEQMDGIRAGLHAVTNARPYVATGEFAMGAGVGFSGSKEAIALGGAYGINSQLSVSGTFHYETSGKYSSSDVAGGVGVQYRFK